MSHSKYKHKNVREALETSASKVPVKHSQQRLS